MLTGAGLDGAAAMAGMGGVGMSAGIFGARTVVTIAKIVGMTDGSIARIDAIGGKSRS